MLKLVTFGQMIGVKVTPREPGVDRSAGSQATYFASSGIIEPCA